MYQSTHHRAKQSCDCQGNGQKIQPHGEGEIQFDRLHHLFGQGKQMGQLLNLVIHQSNIRSVYGNVTAYAAHGNAHIGLFQRRRVIDPVTDHADIVSKFLEGSDLVELVFGQAVCVDLADAQLFSNDIGRVLVIPRQKDRLNAKGMNPSDHLGAFLTNGIRQDDITRQSIINGKVYHRAAIQEILSRCGGKCAGNGHVFQQLQISGSHRFAVYDGGHTCAGDHGELLCLLRKQALFCRYAIVTILAYAGLRISECLELRMEDVSLQAREITVRHGKGDKMRVVYFGDKVVNAVREYLRSRPKTENPYLFPGRGNSHLTRGQVNRIFNAHSTSITPHTLRHFFCSNALENGYSIGELANQAGHSNIHTTLLYTNPTREKMKEKANML